MSDKKYKDVSLPEAAGSCLLCNEAPCTKACPHGLNIDKIIRSIRFENLEGASEALPEVLPCISCETKECEKACLKAKINTAVPISDVMQNTYSYDKIDTSEVDLSIDFCGIHCENPFFLSSSVVANNYEMVAKAFDMGWSGVVFKTIGKFVPNEVSPRFHALHKESLPFVGFENIEQISEHSLEENLLYLMRLKRNYPNKIIGVSIMGRDEEEWTSLAKLVTNIGADIIECNFSCPHMAANGLGSDVGQNPELVTKYTKAVRKGTSLPILAKMTPNIVHMEIPAIAAMRAGADGIAAINTIKSISNVDLDTFASVPTVSGKTSVGGYSGKAVKPIALRFINSMKSNNELKDVPISGMGGIETWRDAAEFIAMGCENIQVTTSVMQYGYRIVEDMIEGLKYYLASHGYKSVKEIVGKALPNIIDAESLDRESICYPKFDKSKCIGCGRCYLSCYDGGHQAIRQSDDGKPILDGSKCVGCHLCATVCPVKAISPGTRLLKKSLISASNLVNKIN